MGDVTEPDTQPHSEDGARRPPPAPGAKGQSNWLPLRAIHRKSHPHSPAPATQASKYNRTIRHTQSCTVTLAVKNTSDLISKKQFHWNGLEPPKSSNDKYVTSVSGAVP